MTKTRRAFGLGALTMISAIVHGACSGAESNEITGPSPTPTTTATGSSSGASSGTASSSGGSSSGGSSSGGSSSSSGSSSGSIPDGGSTDAKADVDAGPTCPPGGMITAADLDKDPGWKPAKAPYAACTNAEILQFEKNLKDTNIKTWSDLGTDLGATCAECIITENTKASWGPIVVTAGSGGTKGYYNFGACFGALSTAACGKAVQYLEHCLDQACDACAKTDSERQACIETASDVGGICSSLVTTLQAECKTLSSISKFCNTISDGVKSLCGPKADAGNDAGN